MCGGGHPAGVGLARRSTVLAFLAGPIPKPPTARAAGRAAPILCGVRDRFEQPSVWGHLADDPKIRHRARMLEEMIPAGVERILDVGCGDGAVTDHLAQRWDVTGVDQSPTALQHVRSETVLASATELPFDDGSFDLVLTSEMLEHLTTDDYRRAIAEMSRVTRRYLLVSVPYREVLEFRTVRCPACGGADMSGVIDRDRFTAESLIADLGGYAVAQTRTFGPLQEPRWSRGLLWISHHVLRSYYSAAGQRAVCERCGNTEFDATRPIGPILQRVNARIPPRGRPRMPFGSRCWPKPLSGRAAARPGSHDRTSGEQQSAQDPQHVLGASDGERPAPWRAAGRATHQDAPSHERAALALGGEEGVDQRDLGGDLLGGAAHQGVGERGGSPRPPREVAGAGHEAVGGDPDELIEHLALVDSARASAGCSSATSARSTRSSAVSCASHHAAASIA